MKSLCLLFEQTKYKRPYNANVIKIITFPKCEHELLINRLENDKGISTTRVDKDFGKFKMGDILNSDLGYILKVRKLETYNNIKNHPYYSLLTLDQVNLIKSYKQFDVLWLVKVSKI